MSSIIFLMLDVITSNIFSNSLPIFHNLPKSDIFLQYIKSTKSDNDNQILPYFNNIYYFSRYFTIFSHNMEEFSCKILPKLQNLSENVVLSPFLRQNPTFFFKSRTLRSRCLRLNFLNFKKIFSKT